MGTLLYLTLKVLGKINMDDDWLNVCHLLAIDSIAFSILIHGFLRRRRGSAKEKRSDET
ncbi:MAG: hypothetical protein WD768_17170 [Phycisphaeraceae bacterium]